MRDRELYARILGIEAPWRVEGVELKLEEGRWWYRWVTGEGS